MFIDRENRIIIIDYFPIISDRKITEEQKMFVEKLIKLWKNNLK